jgi:hypothetical protein
MSGACSGYGGEERRIPCFGGKPDGQSPLGRQGCKWEDNIKMDLQKSDVGVWTGPSWLRIGTVGGHL